MPDLLQPGFDQSVSDSLSGGEQPDKFVEADRHNAPTLALMQRDSVAYITATEGHIGVPVYFQSGALKFWNFVSHATVGDSLRTM